MPSDLFRDRPQTFAQSSGNQRQVNLINGPLGKLRGQAAMRFVIFRDNETAARFLVEPMDNAGSFFSADAGEFWKMMKQGVHERVLALTGPRMNDQSRRFIDHDQIVVFVKNVERNRLRFDVDLFRRWLGDLNAVAETNGIAWPGRGAI